MSYYVEDVVFKFIILPVCALLCVFVVYMLLVMLPAMALAERECLRLGYPTTKVTFMLERYCMTLDGAISVRVDRTGE